MCPSPLGRIHTRVATMLLPALLGAALSVVTGKAAWLAFVGLYLLLGVALDAAVYSWLLRHQRPWVTGLLGLVELGLLYALAAALDLGLSWLETLLLFAASWGLATITRIVFLPMLSLTYSESGWEFRRVDWSVTPAQVSLPVVAASADRRGALVRAASGLHPTPLEPRPGLSGAHVTPAEPSPDPSLAERPA